MHYINLLAMTALSIFVRSFPKDTTLPLTQRVAVAAETAKGKFQYAWKSTRDTAAAMMSYFKGNSLEDQQRRLRFYLKLDPKKHHPKRWIPWVLIAKMAVNKPDEQISDVQFQEYYVLFKQLLKLTNEGDELFTYEEEAAARHEALRVLHEYRYIKGLTQDV